MLRLTEVAQQCTPTTASDFAEAQHRLKFLPLDLLLLISSLPRFKHLTLEDHILQAVYHPGIRRQTITPGTPCLLIIGLNRLRQIQVRNETYIGLIDPHTEGDSRHHNDTLFRQETVLIMVAQLRRQARMIWEGVKTLLGQPGGSILYPLAGHTVDNSGIARVFSPNKA